MALQLLRINPFSGIELLSPGRWRMIHTNAIAYGFIANAFLGMLQWVVPRLTLQPVYNPKLPVLKLTCPGPFSGPGSVVGRHGRGALAGRGPGRWNGARRPSGSTRSPSSGCCWWPSTTFRRSPRSGPDVRLPLVLPGRLRLDVPDLRDGQLHAPVLRLGHEPPAPSAACSSTTWSACSSRPWAGA